MDVPTARLGMRTDGGRIGSSPRSWRLCLGCASHSSWDILGAPLAPPCTVFCLPWHRMGAITATRGSQQKAFSQEWKKGFFIAAGQAG